MQVTFLMLVFVTQEHSLCNLYIKNSLCRLQKVHGLSDKMQEAFIFMYQRYTVVSKQLFSQNFKH
jgi:hypothetical protein